LLGLDPLAVANEGRLVAFVAAHDAERALQVMRRQPVGQGSAWIGAVPGVGSRGVSVRTPLGVQRPLDMLSGEQLPRIC
jgi:hydrogenase expression/formation protein HypE